MSKQYLVKCSEDTQGERYVKMHGKEVEVLDILQVGGIEYDLNNVSRIRLGDYLKSNNLQIIKIKE